MRTTILIELSEGCNLDCSYCLQDKRSKDSLTLDKFKNSFNVALSRIDPKHCDGLDLHFYGGEPLLYFSLIKEITSFINSLYYYNNLGQLQYTKEKPSNELNINISYVMPTNLLALTNEKEDFLIDNRVSISFSHDGLNQHNRPLLNGNSSIPIYDEKTERIKRFIQRTKDNGIGFKIHSMIFPYFKILDNFNFLYEKFGVKPEFNIVKDHGVWDEKSLPHIINELEILLDNSIKSGIIHPYFVSGIHKIFQYKVDGFTSNCGAGFNNFSILDNGEVKACERLKGEDDVELLQYLDHPKCRVCPIRNYCNKGCPFETSKKGLVPLCDYYLRYFNICLELIELVKTKPKMLTQLKDNLKSIITS